MKIAFIGTHGCGKTTLVYELCSELKKHDLDVGQIEEIARQCPLPINEQTTREAQIWIMATTIAKEIEMQRRYTHVICDRSIIDNYVYYYKKFGHDPVLYDLVKHWIKTYDHLFKVKINEKYLKPDNIRAMDKLFQHEIEQKLEELLDETKIKHHQFNSIKECFDIIQNSL